MTKQQVLSKLDNEKLKENLMHHFLIYSKAIKNKDRNPVKKKPLSPKTGCVANGFVGFCNK